ncbi:MAG: hypothetical protein WCO71_07800 [Pseudomonadota bacterium]
MVRSSDSVVIGKGPDFATRLGSDEVSHAFSFAVNRPRSPQASVVPSGVSSDKSLATAVEILKQKIAAYGWRNNTQVTWSSDIGLTGAFSSIGCKVVMEYRFHDRLHPEQREQLARNIVIFFAVL